MTKPTISPFGSWVSPITADLVSAHSLSLGDLAVDGAAIYWVEGRPSESGRNVIVCSHVNGRVQDRTPQDFNVRSRVHEYGGGAFTVHDSIIWFCNDLDQRIYEQRPDAQPIPVTASGNLRYADLVFDPTRHRLICIREDHSKPEQEPVNELVAVNLKDGTTSVLKSGHDFYSSPRISPDGTQIAWLGWNHPDMPWDNTVLWLGCINDRGQIDRTSIIAGGGNTSIVQPEWSPDGVLHFISDKSGWWNIYRHDGNHSICLYPAAMEFARPQWQFGMRSYDFLPDSSIIATCNTDGSWKLVHITDDGTFNWLITEEYSEFSHICCGDGFAACVCAGPALATHPVCYRLAEQKAQPLKVIDAHGLDDAYISKAQPISIKSERDGLVHAMYYPPWNPDYTGPDQERPPLLVTCHGGPTGAAGNVLNLKLQFWTSRGFAVLDVDYRGSSGYGRAYREALNGLWGIADVEDCAAAANYLVTQGIVDAERVAIRGSSAGGFTVLAALVATDTFKAGASYYGIGDLVRLAKDTHKFESRYLDRLVAKWPDDRDEYIARSPLHHTDKLSCPIIFFQGTEDRVVPPAQAESMVKLMRQKGLPVTYLAFEGEQHGFRLAHTIRRCLKAELAFYGQVFGFIPDSAMGGPEIDPL